MTGKLQDFEAYNTGYLEDRTVAGRWISELSKINPGLRHSAGATYLCRLPNGYLKIGTSTNLPRRMNDLRAELIDSLPGGETLEIMAHYELRSYRIPCKGEVFFDRQEVRDWFLHRLQKYNNPTLTPTGSTNEALHITQKECPSCLTTKPLLDFGKHKTSKTGWYTQCKSCRFKMLPKSMQVRP